jgi:hypothetical protein
MQKNGIKIFVVISLLNGLIGCSNKTYPTGTYQEAAVTVDGDLKEWNEPLRFGSTGGQVQYNITNDNENIYISLETPDEATATKILRAGINIYFDPAAGSSKNTCLAFPLANTNLPPKKINSGGGKPDLNGFRQGLLIQAISFTTAGFKNMENRVYDVSDKKGIKVALKSLPNNGLGYEAVIPMQYIFGNTAAANNNGNRKINVGIIINAMKAEGQNQRNMGNTSSGSAGGMHGGGRGGGGRGMGGGGNHQRSGNSENKESSEPGVQTPDKTALYKADVNWYKFKLATKQ